MYFTRYTVRGSGVFPFDMLRYDQSFPAGSEDAHSMSGDYSTETRSITLGRYTKQKAQGEPTYGRWISFGWAVDKSSIESQLEQELQEERGWRRLQAEAGEEMAAEIGARFTEEQMKGAWYAGAERYAGDESVDVTEALMYVNALRSKP